MSQHPQIKCRAAVESSIKLLIKRFENAKCDSDGVSECARCNAVFLAKSVREMLEGTHVSVDGARSTALEEAAQLCELGASHVTLGGALGEYGRGILADTAASIRKLKAIGG